MIRRSIDVFKKKTFYRFLFILPWDGVGGLQNLTALFGLEVFAAYGVMVFIKFGNLERRYRNT